MQKISLCTQWLWPFYCGRDFTLWSSFSASWSNSMCTWVRQPTRFGTRRRRPRPKPRGKMRRLSGRNTAKLSGLWYLGNYLRCLFIWFKNMTKIIIKCRAWIHDPASWLTLFAMDYCINYSVRKQIMFLRRLLGYDRWLILCNPFNVIFSKYVVQHHRFDFSFSSKMPNPLSSTCDCCIWLRESDYGSAALYCNTRFQYTYISVRRP